MNGYSDIGHKGFAALDALSILYDTSMTDWVHGPINPLWLQVSRASGNTLRIHRVVGGGAVCVEWRHAKGHGYGPNIRYSLYQAWQALKGQIDA
jgi:hypothetical protein